MSEGNAAVEVTRAKVGLVLELAKLERDTLVSGLTEDEMESIVVAILRCRTAGPFTSLGKQVLAHGSHYADAINVHTAEFITDALNRKVSTSDETARLRESDDLRWFSDQHRLSLDHYSPWYGDDDDQSVEWRVSKESGSINDREWEIVGRGETVAEAIAAARTALQSQDIPS